MTVTSANGNSSAYAYLQSLLHSGASTGASPSSDPLTSLMNSFYPNSPAGETTGGVTGSPPPPMNCGPMMSPDSMSALILTQEQGSRTSRPEMLFAKLDVDGDGNVNRSEFQNVFGPKADMSKVDGLFSALDSDNDGKVSGDEFMSAVQNAKSQYGHRRERAEGDGEGGDPLQKFLNGTGVKGAKSQTTTAADGSTTTTISYADGSRVSMTTQAASGGQTSTGGNTAEMNALEQLIKMQAQFVSRLSAPASSLVATV